MNSGLSFCLLIRLSLTLVAQDWHEEPMHEVQYLWMYLNDGVYFVKNLILLKLCKMGKICTFSQFLQIFVIRFGSKLSKGEVIYGSCDIGDNRFQPIRL